MGGQKCDVFIVGTMTGCPGCLLVEMSTYKRLVFVCNWDQLTECPQEAHHPPIVSLGDVSVRRRPLIDGGLTVCGGKATGGPLGRNITRFS